MPVRLQRWLCVSLRLWLLLCLLDAALSAQQASLPVWEGSLEHRFLSSKGKRGFVFTLGPEGVEAYIYPFRVFHDLRISLQRKGSNTKIDATQIARSATITPSKVVRHYASDALSLTETLFAPVDQPVVVLLYEVTSAQPVHIFVQLRPDLDLMWPGGIGGQEFSWDASHNAFRIEEPSNTYHAMIGSPATVSHSNPADRSRPWITDKVLSFEIIANPHETVPVIASIGLPQAFDALDSYTRAQHDFGSWLQEADQHYRDILSRSMQIETGDPAVDQPLAWATIALAQAEACNVDLGCGLVAGYGPTWDTRRPQYAWFFAGDALVSSWALQSMGAEDELLRALQFIRKYQNPDSGAIWHELSQSANYVDWFHRYPYIYRHPDISPLYLLAIDNIWRSTADHAFLEQSWSSVEKAWQFCLAQLDPEDDLMLIRPDQSGVNENEADRTVKELPLEMIWAAGAAAFADLATAEGNSSLAEKARLTAQKTKDSLQKFWTPARNYYYEGFTAAGSPLQQEMSSPLTGVALGLFPSLQRDHVLDRLNQPAFRTAWGVRSIPSDDPHYQPDSYAHGSVWPLTTGEYILATLAAHEPQQAWGMWQALLQQSFIASPGHIPEVLSGAEPKPLDVAVPEQTWSSAALLDATVRGILGFHPDAPHHLLTFEPHLPPSIKHLALRNYYFGGRNLSFELRTDGQELTLQVRNTGRPFRLQFEPMISGNTAAAATVDGKAVPVSTVPMDKDVHARLSILIEETSTIRLHLTLAHH